MNFLFAVQNKNKIRIQIDSTPLGKGGEGSVYRIVSPHEFVDSCFKEYISRYQNKERKQKISFMIANPPRMLSNDKIQICWPLALVENAQGEFLGYVMPLAKAGSEELKRLVNIENKRLGSEWQKFFGDTKIRCELSLKVCVNICIAVHLVHNLHKYVFVDMKPENIMISNTGVISLVDCDSLQIKDGSNVHYSRVNTPEYTPPEGFNVKVSDTIVKESWDRFSLAVILYQILFRIHPYMATFAPPYDKNTDLTTKIRHGLFVHGKGKQYLSNSSHLHTPYTRIHVDLQKLFQSAFDDNDYRPSAKEWGEMINRLLKLNKHGLTFEPPTVVTPITYKNLSTHSAIQSKTVLNRKIRSPASQAVIFSSKKKFSPTTPKSTTFNPSYKVSKSAKVSSNNIDKIGKFIFWLSVVIGCVVWRSSSFLSGLLVAFACFCFFTAIFGFFTAIFAGIKKLFSLLFSPIFWCLAIAGFVLFVIVIQSDNNYIDTITETTGLNNDFEDQVYTNQITDDYYSSLNNYEENRFSEESYIEEPYLESVPEYINKDEEFCGYVFVDELKVYQKPSIYSQTIGSLNYNQYVCGQHSLGDSSWLAIQKDYDMGFVEREKLSSFDRTIRHSACGLRDNEQLLYVSGLGVNVRVTPQTNDDNVIGVIQQGEAICAYQRSGNWYGYETKDGHEVWIDGDYISYP